MDSGLGTFQSSDSSTYSGQFFNDVMEGAELQTWGLVFDSVAVIWEGGRPLIDSDTSVAFRTLKHTLKWPL